MRNPILCVAAVIVLAIAMPGVGQSERTNPAQQDDRIIVGTNLITLNVIVTDSNGRYVTGLERNKFEVYDDKVKQDIAHFSANDSPVSLGIVCEIHESTPDRARAMLAAIKSFTNTLSNRDDFFFVAFSKYGSVNTGFIPSWEQLRDHLKFVKPGGPSSFYDAVYLATQRLQSAPNLKKALLVISDGRDERSQHTYKELRNRLRTFDAQIYAIGIADPNDQFAGHGRWVFEDITRQSGRRSFLVNSEASLGRAVLSELSRASGGVTYFPQSETEPELTAICTQISVELRQQYTLGFYSRQPAGDKWHRIKVQVP
ncbi:MAG TPA: VWA domain-containing protein, partial [Candidatus Saccharimonadales bacterium]|nr:VWA domain-containing protein [Candidatus Saccharimonadales bacterium]